MTIIYSFLNSRFNYGKSFLLLVTLITQFATAQSIIVQPGVQVGTVNESFIREISGIAVSRSVNNTIWAHEDSGADPVFYGIDITTGQVNLTITLQGAPAVDWEDMAIAPKPGGGNYLYFGDIGDNGASRNTGVDIIRITEPTTTGNATLTNADYKIKRVTYPGVIFLREEDAESLFADPLNGDLYIIQKLNPGRLFKLPVQEFNNPGTYILDSLGAINAPLNKPTAADISPDGKYIIVRNSSNGGTTAYLFVRDIANNETVAMAMKNSPIAINLESEQQGEAIAWAPDGSGFYSISEGENSPIWFYEFSDGTTTVSKIIENAELLTVYPNPANNIVNVKLNKTTAGNKVAVKITDIAGKELYANQHHLNSENVFNINIESINSNLLLLHIMDNDFNKIIKVVKEF